MPTNHISEDDSTSSLEPPSTNSLLDIILNSLEDNKAEDISSISLKGKTSIADFMILASGTSDRHVKSLADNVAVEAKKAGVKPMGTEGADVGEWVLVDLLDVIVHIMQPRTRDFYGLEKLWSMDAAPERAEEKGDE